MTDNNFREQRRELRRQRRLRRHAEGQKHFRRSGSVLAGLVVLGVGTVFLMRAVNVDLPGWLFTWPMILVVFGLFAGASNSFRDAGWLFISGIGVVFLILKNMPETDVWNMIWPTIVIIIGLMMILSPKRKKRWKQQYPQQWDKDYKQEGIINEEGQIPVEPVHPRETVYRNYGDNWLEVVSIFSNVKKQVYTKDFKGGDIVAIFGGAEINLMQADFNGAIHIDMVQVFGGAKLIVPPHWQIRSEIAAIFGGIEDKRTPQVNYDADKVVILSGTTLFGGIEIKSY